MYWCYFFLLYLKVIKCSNDPSVALGPDDILYWSFFFSLSILILTNVLTTLRRPFRCYVHLKYPPFLGIQELNLSCFAYISSHLFSIFSTILYYSAFLQILKLWVLFPSHAICFPLEVVSTHKSSILTYIGIAFHTESQVPVFLPKYNFMCINFY